MTEHPVEALAERFPQMRLEIRQGMRGTEEYKNAVLRGQEITVKPKFSYNAGDSFTEVSTPAGVADVITFAGREDFVHAVRALAYKCEPAEIPESMGASTISGLIDWGKIRRHMKEYAEAGGEDESAEFARFTSDKNNYLSTVIILSSGPYSAVSADRFGMPEDEWRKKSITIRKYHELAHFFSGRLYPENREAIRDEVVADMSGIVSAFGYYDDAAARLFLGTDGENYRPGGRLENYAGEETEAAMKRVNRIIEALKCPAAEKYEDIFALLKRIEEERIGIY